MWTITKQFDFCYGHRVWSQKLNPVFSLDSCLKCRHLHGHQGIINLSLESNRLEDGMVTDFKHLNWFKKWLDDTLDHKFIMDIDDPVLYQLFSLLKPESASYLFADSFVSNFQGPKEYWTVNPNLFVGITEEEKEIYEGLVFVHFVPTSENLARWIFDIVQYQMNMIGVRTKSVQLYETPKSQSIYSN